MAKYYYRVNGETRWQGQSGTAIMAISNKASSGKKIDINSVQIYPRTFFGAMNVADTFTPVPTLLKLVRVTGASAGETWTCSKLDNNAADFPYSTVQVKTKTAYTPNWVTVSPSYTDGTVAIGDTTYTPGSAPSWIANQFSYNGTVLYVASGGNAGRYRIISNTTTALTIETGLVASGSTDGVIQQLDTFCNVGIMKNFTPAANPLAILSDVGKIGRSTVAGSIWSGTNNSSLEKITIRAGEKVSLVPYPLHVSMPLLVDLALTVEGSPDQTYYFQKFMNLETENESVFTIDNNTGSGKVLYIESVSVAEIGTFDTPYFQLVPIGQVDAASLTDSTKKMTPITLDSQTPAVSTNVCEIYTNVPVLPSGAIPQSYIAEGSAGTPRGYNYLNTKDFVGPTYMNVFPEVLPIKAGGYLGNWTSTGSVGFNRTAMKYADVKGRGAPITLREDQTVGLVSGAETATAATAVPQSGWHSFYFSLDFSIEDATTLTVTVLNGLGEAVENARVYIEKSSDNTEILNSLTDSSGIVTSTYAYPGTSVTARIRVRKSSGSPKYVPFETLGTITSVGMTLTCVISQDTIA